jgi:hypothetical protein
MADVAGLSGWLDTSQRNFLDLEPPLGLEQGAQLLAS